MPDVSKIDADGRLLPLLERDVMISAEAIRERIAAVLSGQLTLYDFEDWIVASSWNGMHRLEIDARQLVGAIELRLFEYSAEHIDAADLIAELQALILYGCPVQPFQNTFISVIQPDASPFVTVTSVSEWPDYQFRIDAPQTSPRTQAGSARTVVL